VKVSVDILEWLVGANARGYTISFYRSNQSRTGARCCARCGSHDV